MKKKSIVALLVALVLCFSLCACGGSEPTPEELILGEWVYSADNDYTETLIMEVEGKGSLKQGDENYNVVWSYDEERELYELVVMGFTYFGEIVDKDGAETLLLDGSIEFVKVTEEE